MYNLFFFKKSIHLFFFSISIFDIVLYALTLESTAACLVVPQFPTSHSLGTLILLVEFIAQSCRSWVLFIMLCLHRFECWPERPE